MTAKTIPAVGEVYLGGSPHPLKVMKCTYGFSTALDVQPTAGVTSTKTLFTIPAGCLVDHMLFYVATAFNTSLISIGDTDNVSGWFPHTSDEMKSAAFYGNSLNCTEPISVFKAGKYYAAAGTIKALNAAAVTTGAIHVYLYYTMAPKQ